MYHFIVNPNSRTGRGMKIWREIEAILLDKNISYQVTFTGRTLNASGIVRKIAEQDKPCTIVILGGDGTVNEAVQGLEGSGHITLGYIPIGSGNDFARDLGLPLEPRAALLNILSPKHIVSMDIGLVTGSGQERRFAGSSGMGFDAAICLEALDSPIKNWLNRMKLGKFTYIAIAFHQLFAFRPYPITAVLDEKKKLHFPKGYFICAMNHPYEGGGLKLAPYADGSDGLLDVCVISGLPKPLLPFLLPTAFFGKHLRFRKYVSYHRCRSVTLKARSPLPVHTDGESFGCHRSVTMRTLDFQVSIIAGPSYGEGSSKGIRKKTKNCVN